MNITRGVWVLVFEPISCAMMRLAVAPVRLRIFEHDIWGDKRLRGGGCSDRGTDADTSGMSQQWL